MADSMIDTYDDEYDDYDNEYDNEYDNDFDRVTARDIAQFLHHHAELRAGPRGDDPAERAAFLHRKADLFNRIADQAALIRTDAYVEQVRQMATNARTAAEKTELQLPQQPVGPNQRRTTNPPPGTGGAKSQEKSGASSG
jgi:hypothetical protein